MKRLHYKGLCPLKIGLLIAMLAGLCSPAATGSIPPSSLREPSDDIPPGVPFVLSDEPLGLFSTITIPLKRAGRLFLIETTIDGQSGNLIFDTGASGLVLNKTYFRKYAAFEKNTGGGITGEMAKVEHIKVGRIDISDLYYENVPADLADLSHIENRRNIKVLGLMGINLIRQFEVTFDALHNELVLSRVDKAGNRLEPAKPGLNFDYRQKIDTQHDIILIEGRIGEKVLTFCLDTGAETNVLSAGLPKKVMSTVQITRRSNMVGSGSRGVEVLYGTMRELMFSKHQFGEMETVVRNMEAMSEAYGCTIDGMLGFDFWQKGIFCINFYTNEISFSMNKAEKL